MNTTEYLKIREITKILGSKIFEWGKDKFDYASAGKKLELATGKILVLDDDSDIDSLQDYMIYFSKYKGVRILDSFYEEYEDLDEVEERILEGMINSEMSIFEIYDIDRDSSKCRIYLNNLLNPGTYEVVNLGFSQSASCGLIICARLIELENSLYMASGTSFIFGSNAKDKLLGDYSFERYRISRKLSYEDMFLFCFKKSKLYGKKVKHIEYD